MTEDDRPEDRTQPQPVYAPHYGGGPSHGPQAAAQPAPAVQPPSPWAGGPSNGSGAPPQEPEPVWQPPTSTPPPFAPPPFAPPSTVAQRRPGGAGRVVALLVAAGLIALVSGVAGGFVEHSFDRTAATATPAATATVVRQPPPAVDRSSLAGIAESVQPSVVDINTGRGEGSGVILTAEGAVLTNNHVVDGAAGNTVAVTFSDGKTAQATIVGTDPGGDLAVIKAQGVSGLKAAKFGDSDAMRVGDTVLALGSPLGLQGSVTAGIVSALHRTIGEDSGTGGRRSIADAIQTDAAINPGNSGGALVNTNGEVVGINTAIATAGQTEGNIGVGFAISSNRAKSAADQLLKGGKVTHPFLGVQINDASGGGALIADVVSGGPADKAGLKRGDLVVKAGSQTVNSANDLIAAVQADKPGDQLVLTVRGAGGDRQVTVTLGGS